MRVLHLAFACAVSALATVPASAQSIQQSDFSLSASTGVDYSSGDYGATENTEILVVPAVLRATNGNLAFTASVPYLRIDGPGNVVVGPGGEPLPGAPTASGVREGIGDLSLGATYTFTGAQPGGFELALGGNVKLPTSKESAQLGTGETDYTAKAEVSAPLGGLTPFASVGYRFLGDPEGVDLRSGPTASAGFSTSVGTSVLIASYDYARAITAATEDSHSIFSGLSVPVGSRLNLTGYGVAGLSEGSPDFGVGLLVTAKVF